jgi:hypothetical protein
VSTHVRKGARAKKIRQAAADARKVNVYELDSIVAKDVADALAAAVDARIEVSK